MESIRRIAAVFAGAALAAGLAVGTAQAGESTAIPATATATRTAQHGELISVPMKIVGFDPAVAKAHGYEIRTDAQGHQYSVKIGAKAGSAAARVTPNNSLDGNCGTSYLWYYAIGNQAATLDTGFYNLPAPAIHYTWKVSVTDAIGTGVVPWSGILALRGSWEGQTVTHHGTTGYSTAKVTTGVVELADGTNCVTLQPWDYTYLY
jgi:ABC-type amino acid transport substrate-binding protein